MGTKRSVLTDEHGLPLSVVLSGANTHDVKLLEDTLEHIVVLRPEPEKEHPQNLCMDAGCTGSEKIQAHGYTPYIRPRGEERKELKRNPDSHARRRVVEVTHSFLTVSVNCWFVTKRKLRIILLSFHLHALSSSGLNFCTFIVDFALVPFWGS